MPFVMNLIFLLYVFQVLTYDRLFLQCTLTTQDEVARLRAQLGSGSGRGAVSMEVARREALARPALVARVT